MISALPTQGLPPVVGLAKMVARSFTRPTSIQEARSVRLTRAVGAAWASYVKIGQSWPRRPDVVGVDWALDLSMLQDRMAFLPNGYGQGAGRGFVGETDHRSLHSLRCTPGGGLHRTGASGSRCLSDGERKVAVKVVRPGVRQRFAHDIESMYLISRMQERFLPSTRRLRPVEVTRTLEQTTKLEMDLRLEAAALSEIGENTKNDRASAFPRWTGSGPAATSSPWNGSMASRCPISRVCGRRDTISKHWRSR